MSAPALVRSGPFSEELYVLLREFVRERTGIIYGPSRRAIFETRIGSRIQALGLPGPEAYHRHLLFHPTRHEEFLELASVLTNNETFFFREEPTLAALADRLLKAGGPRRVLSAGASSGEELSTMAMLLKERGADLERMTLTGVDLDVRMVAAAREGVYRTKAFRRTSPERLVRFFSPEGEGRRLRPVIHRHLEYRWANLVDPATLRFPHPFDVILIRNVLIYFDAATVERVLRGLHGLLAPDGVLAIGVSESLAHIPFLFDPFRAGEVILYRPQPL